MNSKIFLIISLICLSVCHPLPEITNWNVTVSALDGSPNITVVHGRYTKILLTLTKIETDTNDLNKQHHFVPSSTSIQLQDNDYFETLLKEYVIDTAESNTYIVHLGVSCDTTLNNGEYELNFENVDDNMKSFLVFNSFKVTFVTDQSLNVIDITPVMTELPMNSKVLFKLNSEILNVDDIKIKFNTDEHDYSFLNDLEFKALDEKSGPFIAYVGEYGVYEYEEGQTNHTYTFEIENECFTTNLQSPFKFSTINQTISPLDKSAIIKSFKQIESTDDDAIEVSINIPANVTLYAAITSDDEFDDIQDIMDMDKNDKMQYFKYFSTEPKENFNIKFSNLQRRAKYRLIFIIQNISNDDSNNYITITVGYFKGADIVKSLYPRSVNDFPAQCATWTFESEVPNDFEKDAEQYCTYIFSGTGIDVKDFFEGCAKCKAITPINKNPNQAVVCVYSKDKCKGKFQGDSIALFKEFVDNLSTGEKINSTLSIPNLVVTEYKIEIDNKEPDKTKIITTLAKKPINKELTVNITSNLQQTIECNHKKNINRLIRNRWISPENLKERSLIIHPNETITFNVTLPHSKPDNKTYNIYLDCYNLPNFDYQFFSTGPFVAGTFLFTDIEEPVLPPNVEIDCSSSANIGKPQCIEKEQPSTNITFESDVPEVFETASDDADDLSRLSIGNQYIMINYALDNFLAAEKEQNSPSGEAIFNIMDKALELVKQMEQFNCTEMDYGECRKKKKGIQMQIVNFFRNFFQCEGIIDMFDKLKQHKSFEEALKTFLLLVETTTANYDAMNKGDSDYYMELYDCIMKEFDNIWTLFNETVDKTEEELQQIKADLTQMLLDIISNLGESNKYDQADKYTEQHVSKGKLIVNEKTKKIKKNIKQTAKMLWEKGPGKWETDNIVVNLTINMGNEVKKQLRTTKEEITYFEIPEYGIKVGLYVNTLMNQFKAMYAEIILYKKYPLLSITNKVVSPKFVAITLYDKSGNEISVKSISKDYLPVILFEKQKNKFPKCVYYNEKNEELQDDGVSSEEREGYVQCKVTHFTDFAVADSSYLDGGLAWWGILLICIAVIIVLGVAFMIWRHISGKGLKSGITESLNTISH